MCNKSTISFSGKTVPYPDAPFGDEDEQELAKDEEWLQAQRLKAFEHFKAILGKIRNNKEYSSGRYTD